MSDEKWKTVSVRMPANDWARAKIAAQRAGMMTEKRGASQWLRLVIKKALDEEVPDDGQPGGA